MYSTVPVPRLREAVPVGWVPIAVYAQVQCREPKTVQEKVQFYCEDNSLFLSSYYLSMVNIQYTDGEFMAIVSNLSHERYSILVKYVIENTT